MHDNLSRRVWVGVVAIPPVLLLSWWGGIPFLLFVDAVIVFGVWEWSALARAKGTRVNLALGLVLSLAVSLDYYLREGADTLVILLLGVILVLTYELGRRGEGSACLNVGATLAAVLYVGVLGGALVLLREHPARSVSPGHLAIFLFVLVWCTDTCAYFVGRWIGKHKPWPRISPNKSLEGAAAGLAGALLAVWIAGQSVLKGLSWPHLVAIALIVAIGGLLGDLAESMLKRDAGVKDTSSLLKGHGGVLDRFDSMFFSAPLVYLLLKYF